MASDHFVIDGICHPYNLSEVDAHGKIGRRSEDLATARTETAGSMRGR